MKHTVQLYTASFHLFLISFTPNTQVERNNAPAVLSHSLDACHSQVNLPGSEAPENNMLHLQSLALWQKMFKSLDYWCFFFFFNIPCRCLNILAQSSTWSLWDFLTLSVKVARKVFNSNFTNSQPFTSTPGSYNQTHHNMPMLTSHIKINSLYHKPELLQTC